MDSLKIICDRQLEFMVQLGLFGADREMAIRDTCLALIVEATEVLNETNWKPWKKTPKVLNEEKIKEEIIDALHFVIELALLMEMRPLDILKEYISKMEINQKRQKGGY